MDTKALAQATAAIVHDHVTKATEPLLKRLEALEARPLPERGEKGDPGEPGPSGVGIRDAFRHEGGVLILTLTDGNIRDLGPIVGPQGERGEKGDTGETGATGDKGETGEQGAAGFSLEDFDVVPVDERTVELKFAREGIAHSYELVFPVPVYRGVYSDKETYYRGDLCTWGGSLFHAERETKAKPESDDWRMCVKKGRDGKDAKA